MPQPPIIGSSGSYNNPRGNPRHGRTSAGQAFQNVQQAVTNAYLLEDIASGAEGLIRFVDRATSEIDTVMTPITAKNISQFDFDKSSICTLFRLPGISTPLLLIGDSNNPETDTIPPLGSIAPSDFINITEMIGPETIDLTSDLGFFLTFSDPDPGGDSSGTYELRMLTSGADKVFVITPGDSGTTDTTPGTPPPKSYRVSGTLDELNNLFQNFTTGTVTTTVYPGQILTWTFELVAPDGRSGITTYHVIGWEATRTLITSNQDIYVDDSGSDLNDGTIGSPYATVTKALSSIAEWSISPAATVTINIGDGTITEGSDEIVVNHKDGDRVVITGTNTYTKTMSSVQSSSGSAGAWSVIINLDTVTNISVGDYATIKNPSAGTKPNRLAGCHEITNVDTTNKRITISVKHKAAATASGAVTATVTIIKTKINIGSVSGIVVKTGLKLIDKLVIIGNQTANQIGLQTSADGDTLSNTPSPARSVCEMGTQCCVVNCYRGVYCAGGCVTLNGVVSGSSDFGVHLRTGGDTRGSNLVISGGASIGMIINGVSSFNGDTNCISTGNSASGFYVNLCGQLGFATGTSDSNLGDGVTVTTMGSAFISGITCNENGGSGVSVSEHSYAVVSTLTTTNNSGFGIFCNDHGFVQVASITSNTGNLSPYSHVFTSTIQRDGSIIMIIAPSAGSYIWDYDIQLASDLVITNQTEQDVTGFTVPVTAGEVWEFEVRGVASANNTTGDASMNIMCTGTWVTANSNAQAVSYSSAGALVNTVPAAFNSTTRMLASPGLSVANGDGAFYPFRVTAQFRVDGTGNAKIVFGNTAAAAGRSSTLYAGARLLARRLKV